MGIVGRGDRKKRFPQFVRILTREAQRSREDSGLMFTARMFRIQAVSDKFFEVNDSAMSSGQFHDPKA